MSLSRRDFIKSIAVFGAMYSLSPAIKLFAEGEQIDHYTNFITALETPYTAPMNAHFEAVTYGHNLGLILYDLKNSRLMTALQSEKLLPVASAFKSGVLMYFVDQIDAEVWGTVPVEHWNANSSDDMAEEYRENWKDHRAILRTLYQMIVLSDNVATGTALAYVAKDKGRTDAVTAFNEWAQDTVGISQLSGLGSWESGLESDVSFVDNRYTDNQTSLNSQLVTLSNMMTARDLGLFYAWMLTHFSEEQRTICKDLLSIIYTNRGANLERLAQQFDGVSYSKNGSLSTEAGYVVSDAGIIDLPDGRQYLLIMQSITPDGAVLSIVPELFEELNKVLAGQYDELLHNRHYEGITPEELKAIYLAHLQEAYTERDDPSDQRGQYRYGFIIPEGVNVYSSPNESDKLHNPIIKSTRFGVHLLMQGALVRYADIDNTWVELMPDDARDNVRSRLGVRMFVKKEDVWSISLNYAEPIPYLINDVPAEDKYIVINVGERELAAFEGATPILRVPIVLNPDATPRGAQVITSKWFARSMQPWAPGVPFTSFFGNQGFALHGSPWQRWTSTVNKETIMGRTSAGCVNIPDWMIRVGEYTRPADELIFRWVGGMENQRENVFDYPSPQYPALRIFAVDYLHNLNQYYMPQNLVDQGITWDSVAEAMESIPVQAPDSFFV